ncbi:hypothetical protein HOT82_gp139 [Gordonia phage Ronaldo]|uniref:Uncharacterized protein n=3 Tax=Ronaldovirus TaxID=2733205 RepID=A0A6B9L904_9CAUD|nr:hypothetical protein HOT81_gp136 [Gordonia phage Fryberger]YP_009807830.1 hypothetical protein HOT82_gp139 [Gordonia phage Ronaldo]AXN53547.1 hypothetical protein SEA_FRYBERGER_134 [Gordonia phage Fryberger]AXN53694.1 hypothetical protein SEA_RONALDO_136 [Gordonia phage Ronaldo]QHB38250.1 hypothetical protein SEA_VOLT_139 [Gordonia phage Volt]
MTIVKCENCSRPMSYDEGFTLMDQANVTSIEFCSRKCLVHFIATNVAEWSKELNERLA